jgi:hypothetical protein
LLQIKHKVINFQNVIKTKIQRLTKYPIFVYNYKPKHVI